MSIYDNAGVVLIPSGTKASKLYSVLPANGDGDFTHSRGSTATRVNKDGFIESVATNVPRLDYPLIDGVVQDCPALLLEPSRTNRLPYSNDFTNSAWGKFSNGTGSVPTVTANYAISPDGSQNASRLQINKGSGTTSDDYSTIEDFVSFFSSSGSLSIYMKSNDSNTYKIALRNYGDIAICNVTTEWQRFYIENATNPTMFQLILRGNYDTSDNADLLIYGAQLEEGSYATSYIPTSGSTVTRSADYCTNSGTSAEFNTSEGVLFVEAAALADDLTFRQVTLNDGSLNTILVGYRSNSNRIYTQLVSNNVSQAFLSYDVSDITEFHKFCIKYSTNSVHFWVDGYKRASDTSATMPLALTDLDLQGTTGSAQFNAKTKQVITFKTALTDSELETLTSWDSFNAMAKGQLYTIE